MRNRAPSVYFTYDRNIFPNIANKKIQFLFILRSISDIQSPVIQELVSYDPSKLEPKNPEDDYLGYQILEEK